MGKEVITIHLGQAGVQMSHALWESVCLEHGVTSSGIRFDENDELEEQGREYVFNEVCESKFVPRAILVDLEPSVVDEIRTGPYKNLWHPQQLITGKEDAASNFARGYYSQSRIEMFNILDRIRVLVEQCENVSCFKLLYSSNGGTGSGLTSALCERLTDEYGKKHKLATSVYPSPGYSELMVEPYNSLLHSSTNLTFCDCVILTDNEAMLNVVEDNLKLSYDGFTTINRVLANAVTTQFLSHRYKFIGQQCTHINDLLINLIPYPRIHFPMMAFAPFLGPAGHDFERSQTVDLVRSVFDDTNQLLSITTAKRAYISCALLFRGIASPAEVIKAIRNIKGDRIGRAKFVDWCPTGFKLGLNIAPPNSAKVMNNLSLKNTSLGMIAGNLAIRDVWTGISRRFDQLYQKRAYVHWYISEGMEEGEFTLAREVIQQLIEDYEAIAKDAETNLFDTTTPTIQTSLPHQNATNTIDKSFAVKQINRHSSDKINNNLLHIQKIDETNSQGTIDTNEQNHTEDINQQNIDSFNKSVTINRYINDKPKWNQSTQPPKLTRRISESTLWNQPMNKKKLGLSRPHNNNDNNNFSYQQHPNEFVHSNFKISNNHSNFNNNRSHLLYGTNCSAILSEISKESLFTSDKSTDLSETSNKFQTTSTSKENDKDELKENKPINKNSQNVLNIDYSRIPRFSSYLFTKDMYRKLNVNFNENESNSNSINQTAKYKNIQISSNLNDLNSYQSILDSNLQSESITNNSLSENIYGEQININAAPVGSSLMTNSCSQSLTSLRTNDTHICTKINRLDNKKFSKCDVENFKLSPIFKEVNDVNGDEEQQQEVQQKNLNLNTPQNNLVDYSNKNPAVDLLKNIQQLNNYNSRFIDSYEMLNKSLLKSNSLSNNKCKVHSRKCHHHRHHHHHHHNHNGHHNHDHSHAQKCLKHLNHSTRSRKPHMNSNYSSIDDNNNNKSNNNLNNIAFTESSITNSIIQSNDPQDTQITMNNNSELKNESYDANDNLIAFQVSDWLSNTNLNKIESVNCSSYTMKSNTNNIDSTENNENNSSSNKMKNKHKEKYTSSNVAIFHEVVATI